MTNLRIVFRSDTRPPESVFSTGFLSRNLDRPIRFNYDNIHNNAGDVDKNYSVSVTPRFSAAAFFPVDPRQATSYIYMALVNVQHMPCINDFESIKIIDEKPAIEIKNAVSFNTHAHQFFDGVNQMRIGMQENADHAFWCLHTNEIAFKSIPSTDIIAAISFSREFPKEDPENTTEALELYSKGIPYKLASPIIKNENFIANDLSRDTYLKIGMKYLNTELKEYSIGKTPSFKSGFQKSLLK